MPDALFVFLAPPAWDELVRRLVGRGTEDAEEREARLATARVELAAAQEFDVTRAQRRRSARGRRTRIIDEIPRHRSEVRPSVSGTVADPIGITNPPIDELLERADSKYALVLYSAKRARQINAYYAQLQEGLLEYVGPLVDSEVHEKPMSIALREINEGSPHLRAHGEE